MRKVTTIVAAAAVALAFTACNKTNNSVTPEVAGESYASVRVDLSTNSLKAVNDSQNDNKGTEAESKVSSMQLIGVTGASWGAGEYTAAENVYTFNAKPVSTTGAVTTGMLINGDALGVTAADQNATFGTEATAVADLAKLATDNKFAMSSDVMGQTIKPNISAADAPTQNLLDFGKVERLVSKGIVQKDASYDDKVKDGTGKIDFKTVKYAAVNGAAEIYTFHNNAGARTLTTDGNKEYTNFKSAIHNAAVAETAEAAKTSKIIRRGNLGNDLGMYASVAAVDPSVTDLTDNNPGVSKGVYFLENSGEMNADNKAKGFYRFAYAKIYATFVPTEIWKLDESDALVKATDYVAGTTFYRGDVDGRFYLTKEAAKKSTVNGAADQKASTYKDGRCFYRALWNRQSPEQSGLTDFKLVTNANTRRNNIYVLNIEGFQKIGMPWDPSDPNDPDLPKPDDKDEPDPKDNPNIEDQDTYVAAKAVMEPWNVVGRKVLLK